MAAKGLAQHIPFKALALLGQLILFFILVRNKGTSPRNLRKVPPNMTLKLTNQTIGYRYAGELLTNTSSLNKLPKPTATEMAIKKSPNARLTAISCNRFCTNN